MHTMPIDPPSVISDSPEFGVTAARESPTLVSTGQTSNYSEFSGVLVKPSTPAHSSSASSTSQDMKVNLDASPTPEQREGPSNCSEFSGHTDPVKINGDDNSVSTNEEENLESDGFKAEISSNVENLVNAGISNTSTVGKNSSAVDSDHRDAVEAEAWKAEERHVFVLSSSGKPVYSRHGSEDKLVTLFGVMQALVSIVEVSDDVIEVIHFGKSVIVFQIRGPIILVAVSKKNDSIRFCNNQLTYVYNQIVSVLTLKQVTSIFERRQNYDLRRLLTGSERLIDHLLQFYETEPSIFMNGISCVPMPSAHRDAISSAIISSCSKIKNLVFAVLIANNKVVALARKRGYAMSPSDLHLILNMVAASESLKTAESWTPICLPNFNADGFLYAHVSYMADDSPACLLLLTVDQELFFQLSEAKKKITEKLIKNKSMSLINEVLKAPPSLWMSLHALGLSKIRHFIYKCKKTSNVVSSPMTPPYSTPAEASALFTKYQTLHSRMIESNPQIHELLQVSAEETVVCLLTEKFEMLVAVEPMVKKQLTMELITKLRQWVQSEEDRFFLSNVPYL